MCEGAAFLAAIIADPDDDTARLVYADWLDEHEQSARAEFIRVQLELAGLPEGHPRRTPLEARAAELLRVHERSWVPADRLALFYEWRRGFVAVLKPCARGVFGEDSLKVLSEFPLAEDLQFGFCMGDDEFRHMPTLPNLRSFGVGGNARITDVSVRRIGRWRTLRSLRLNGDQVTDETLPHLTGLTELRELDLSYTAVTDAGLRHLVALPALEALDLSETRVTGAGPAVLCGLPRLRRLNLANTTYWEPGLGGLAGCRNLEELRLGSDLLLQPVTDVDLAVLRGLPALRVLDLGGWGEISDPFVTSVRRHLPSVELRFAG